MNTTNPNQATCQRSRDKGAILMVVLIVMIALLGLGMTGLFLTSSSIQMNTNINLRNQALVVAEAGIERARGVLNNRSGGWSPPIPYLLAGSISSADEVPTATTACAGQSRGAILVDPINGPCAGTPTPASCWLKDVDYPSVNRTGDLPAGLTLTAGAAIRSTMGQYTVYIRQDQADCRMANYTCELAPDIDGGTCNPPLATGVPQPNGAVVVRSEGVASDGRTRVVLEVTLTPNQGPRNANNTPISGLCGSGCDDNTSVQTGIVVNSGAPEKPPTSNGGSAGGGAGGAGGSPGTGGAPGAGGTTVAITGSTGGAPGTGGKGTGGAGTGGAVGTGGSCGGTGCAPPKTCCPGNICVDTSSDNNHCGSSCTACGPGQVCQASHCAGLCLMNAVQAVGACSGGGAGCVGVDMDSHVYGGGVAMTCPSIGGGKCSSCINNCAVVGTCLAETPTCNVTTMNGGALPTAATLPAPTAGCAGYPDLNLNSGFQTKSTSNNLPTCLGMVVVGSGATLTLNPGNYIMTSFNLNSGGNLIINDQNGTVRLWVMTAVALSGTVTTQSNNSGSFWLIYNGTQDSNMNGGSMFHGVIFAPAAHINLDYKVYGAVLGNSVTLNSNSEVHYDPTVGC